MDATRREYLAAAVGITATAGCLGGGGGSGGASTGDGSATSELSPPTLGPTDAGVTVQAFEDFACPHCATYSLEVFPRVRVEFVDPGTVRYEHHDLPLPVDEEWSWKAASAARGVQEETDDETFFEYADLLFKNQGEYSLSLLGELAEEVGAPADAIREDAAEETYRSVLETDRQRGIDMGAGGTPAVFVDGELVDPTFDAIASAIETAQ
jgi:protein-disulfide isomerase